MTVTSRGFSEGFKAVSALPFSSLFYYPRRWSRVTCFNTDRRSGRNPRIFILHTFHSRPGAKENTVPGAAKEA